jgi:hypothetical protein
VRACAWMVSPAWAAPPRPIRASTPPRSAAPAVLRVPAAHAARARQQRPRALPQRLARATNSPAYTVGRASRRPMSARMTGPPMPSSMRRGWGAVSCARAQMGSAASNASVPTAAATVDAVPMGTAPVALVGMVRNATTTSTSVRAPPARTRAGAKMGWVRILAHARAAGMGRTARSTSTTARVPPVSTAHVKTGRASTSATVMLGLGEIAVILTLTSVCRRRV